MPLEVAREVLRREIAALESVAERLGPSFTRAIELIAAEPAARVAASGIGKAGIIAQKSVATLSSTGTPAFFLHPADALHGDLGMAAPGDVALLLSNSGESSEVVRLVPYLRRRGLAIVAITGSARSTLGVQADAALELGPIAEACPLGFAPTSSTTAMLALTDALAMALMRRRAFTATDYGQLHPAGELGRAAVTVDEVMRGHGALARVYPDAPVRAALAAMTEARAGAALVVDADGRLAGIFTDGDLRRALLESGDLLERPIREVILRDPRTIRRGQSAREALEIIRDHRIGELPVLDENGKVVGIVDRKSLEF